MLPQTNLKNHLLAISVLTLISGLIIFLQFKNINRRIYRLETSMSTLSKEITNYQLSTQQPNNSMSASQDQQIQQLQNEYQEYQFQENVETKQAEDKLEDSDNIDVDANGEDVVDLEDAVADDEEDGEEDGEEDDEEEEEDEDDEEEQENNEEDQKDNDQQLTENTENTVINPAGQAALNRQQENLSLTSEDFKTINRLEIEQMTVAQLKESIKKKGGSIPSKVVKADLVQIYQTL